MISKDALKWKQMDADLGTGLPRSWGWTSQTNSFQSSVRDQYSRLFFRSCHRNTEFKAIHRIGLWNQKELVEKRQREPHLIPQDCLLDNGDLPAGAGSQSLAHGPGTVASGSGI